MTLSQQYRSRVVLALVAVLAINSGWDGDCPYTAEDPPRVEIVQ